MRCREGEPALHQGSMRHYLDHNATSPLRPEARTAMLAALEGPHNPSSVHAEGRAGRKIIETARIHVARLVGADPKGVTFTGGGTEANNTALSPQLQFGAERRLYRCLFVSAIEHPCVLAGGRFAADAIQILPVTPQGVLDLAALEDAISGVERPFVSVMAANNETGVLQPLAEIARIVHARSGFFHVDAVQAAGRIALDIFDCEADVMTVSGHKIGAPQGTGALIRRLVGIGIPALIRGGGQELYCRGGTENVAALAGFGAAAEAALTEADATRALRDRLENGLRTLSGDIRIFGDKSARLPNTTCFALPGKRAETAVIAYDMAGLAVSSGSACSSGRVGVSHVLRAMGVCDDVAAGAIRVSTGWNTTTDDVDAFIKATARMF